MIRTALLILGLLGTAPGLTPLPLPGGEGGIGFDDLVYSRVLDRVLVPAGRTGRLDLIETKTLAVEPIEGFTTSDRFRGGHGEGTTSADSGSGLIFASDRDHKMLKIVDPSAKRIVGGVELGGGPDYVRWVEPNSEVWVTEPNRKVIEYFKLDTGGVPRLVSAGTISVPDGPESLIVDVSRGRAYTHTWHNATVALDLKTHQEIARWSNGCGGARGIALDEQRGFLFVGCEEGKAIALDVAHEGRRVGSADTGKGVDIIAYNARLQHLYVPGGDRGVLTVLAVATNGALKVLATVPTAPGSHCVAADPLGQVYACDPTHGRLLVYTDKL